MWRSLAASAAVGAWWSASLVEGVGEGPQVMEISAAQVREQVTGTCSADGAEGGGAGGGSCRAAGVGIAPSAALDPAAFGGDGWVACAEASSHVGDEGDARDAARGGWREGGGVTLAYVTPWNGAGYDLAASHAARLDVVVPVWYTVVPLADPSAAEGWGFALEGGHDVDRGWVARVREAGGPTAGRVVPRFLLTLHPAGALALADQGPRGSGAALAAALGALIADEVLREGFDGAALDGFWQTGAQTGAFDQATTRSGFVEAIRTVAKTVRGDGVDQAAKRAVVLAVPPARSGDNARGFGPADLERLEGDVDVFSVMSYDFSAGRTGPNAPLVWVDRTVRWLLGLDLAHQASVEDAVGEALGDATKRALAAKLAIGLNFYGYDYRIGADGRGTTAGEAVLGRQLVDVLKSQEHKVLPRTAWLPSPIAEHTVNYTNAADGAMHAVFYPSPASIKARLDVAVMYGTGVAIWEAGQGLACFWDLL